MDIQQTFVASAFGRFLYLTPSSFEVTIYLSDAVQGLWSHTCLTVRLYTCSTSTAAKPIFIKYVGEFYKRCR
jgi:hypothetical protein